MVSRLWYFRTRYHGETNDEASTPEELDQLVKANNIRFIIVDRDNRISSSYDLNEENIKATYESRYEEGDGEWKLTIYDTKKAIY